MPTTLESDKLNLDNAIDAFFQTPVKRRPILQSMAVVLAEPIINQLLKAADYAAGLDNSGGSAQSSGKAMGGGSIDADKVDLDSPPFEGPPPGYVYIPPKLVDKIVPESFRGFPTNIEIGFAVEFSDLTAVKISGPNLKVDIPTDNAVSFSDTVRVMVKGRRGNLTQSYLMVHPLPGADWDTTVHRNRSSEIFRQTVKYNSVLQEENFFNRNLREQTDIAAEFAPVRAFTDKSSGRQTILVEMPEGSSSLFHQASRVLDLPDSNLPLGQDLPSPFDGGMNIPYVTREILNDPKNIHAINYNQAVMANEDRFTIIMNSVGEQVNSALRRLNITSNATGGPFMYRGGLSFENVYTAPVVNGNDIARFTSLKMKSEKLPIGVVKLGERYFYVRVWVDPTVITPIPRGNDFESIRSINYQRALMQITPYDLMDQVDHNALSFRDKEYYEMMQGVSWEERGPKARRGTFRVVEDDTPRPAPKDKSAADDLRKSLEAADPPAEGSGGNGTPPNPPEILDAKASSTRKAQIIQRTKQLFSEWAEKGWVKGITALKGVTRVVDSLLSFAFVAAIANEYTSNRGVEFLLDEDIGGPLDQAYVNDQAVINMEKSPIYQGMISKTNGRLTNFRPMTADLDAYLSRAKYTAIEKLIPPKPNPWDHILDRFKTIFFRPSELNVDPSIFVDPVAVKFPHLVSYELHESVRLPVYVKNTLGTLLGEPIRDMEFIILDASGSLRSIRMIKQKQSNGQDSFVILGNKTDVDRIKEGIDIMVPVVSDKDAGYIRSQMASAFPSKEAMEAALKPLKMKLFFDTKAGKLRIWPSELQQL